MPLTPPSRLACPQTTPRKPTPTPNRFGDQQEQEQQEESFPFPPPFDPATMNEVRSIQTNWGDWKIYG